MTNKNQEQSPRDAAIERSHTTGFAHCRVIPPVSIDLPADEQITLIYERLVAVDWNAAYAQIYGYPADHDMSKISLNDMMPLSEQRNQEFVQQFVRDDYAVTREEADERDVEGNPIVNLISCAGIVVDGHLTELWATIVDITPQKRAEQALRLSEEKFSKAFHSNPDGTAITRASDGLIVEVNKGYEEISGYSRAELIGSTTAELRLWEDPERRTAAVESLSVDQDVRHFEACFRTKSGEIKTCLTSASMLVVDDVGYVLSTTRDITETRRQEVERERLELQLRQAQKMEAIGQLTGGIAHDFNNILSSVIGYTDLAAELAAEMGQGENSELIQEYLSEVHRVSLRARDIVSQLLTFGRQNRGDARVVSIDEVVDDVVRMLRPTSPAGFEFRVNGGGSGEHTLIDPVRLEQAVMNLCINARDAMQGRGTVSINIKRGEPSFVCASCAQQVSGDYVCLSVQDTGDGIPERSLRRIFDPFFSTKPVGKGTGMGLAIVHGLVHQYGGHIAVTSSPSEGTCFELCFAPVAAVGPGESMHVPFVASENNTAQILVVDDNHSVGTLMGQLLENRGYDVTVLDDSAAAYDFFVANQGELDAVVTDQTMPSMSGLELARRILGVAPELPVILCSGSPTESEMQAAQKVGIRAYHAKPIDTDKLFRELDQLLRKAE